MLVELRNPRILLTAGSLTALVLAAGALAPAARATSLQVNAAAALVDNFGLAVIFDDTTQSAYVQDDSPLGESHYRASFRFNPNAITMVDNKRHKIFQGFQQSPTARLVTVVFRKQGGTNYVLVKAHKDDGSWAQTPWVTIGDVPTTLEIDWTRSSAAGANDGRLIFTVDGSQEADVTGIDNDAIGTIDFVRLGAAGGVDAGTIGTQYFDEFESWR
jgi:hypothetical protein